VYALLTLDFRISPTTFVGSFALLSFSISAVIFVCFYSAQITSNMVSRKTTDGAVRSLDEALMRDFTFCLQGAIEYSVLSRYPNLRVKQVQSPTCTEIFAALEHPHSGGCEAGFVTDAAWRQNVNAHCQSKVKLDSIVYSMGLAMPVRDDLQAPMSWAITRALAAEKYTQFRNDAQLLFLEPLSEECASDGAGVSSASGSMRGGGEMTEPLRSLGLEYMGGPCLLSALACTVAVAIFLLGEQRRALNNERHGAPTLAERTYKMRALQRISTVKYGRGVEGGNDLALLAKFLHSRQDAQVRRTALAPVALHTISTQPCATLYTKRTSICVRRRTASVARTWSVLTSR
jgi:hypothetical protein